MILYRKALTDEADALAKIRVAFLCEINGTSCEEQKETLYQSNRQYLSSSLEDESFVAWVATDNDKIIATSGITFYTLPPNQSCPTGKVAYISNMFTLPEYRKQGIAYKLFSLIVQEAKSRGYQRIILNATDMGRPIYKKYGFKDSSDDMVYTIE